MKPSGARWRVKAEMIRRWDFEQEKRANSTDVDGMARGLRDADSRTTGLQANTDQKQVGATKEKDYQKTTAGEMGGTMESDDKEENRMKTLDNNPSAPAAPPDSIRFDFAAMDHIGNALFHSKEDWAHAIEGARALRLSGPLLSPKRGTGGMVGSMGYPGGRINNRICQESYGDIDGRWGDMVESPEKALRFLSSKQTTRDIQLPEGGSSAASAMEINESGEVLIPFLGT